MVFASLEFLLLFLPAFLLVYALGRPAWRNTILLIGSWLFYGWLSPLFLALHMVLTVIAWVGGLIVDRAREGSSRRMRWLVGLIVLNTAVLCWYKYANILALTANELMSAYGAMPFEWQRVALPAGCRSSFCRRSPTLWMCIGTPCRWSAASSITPPTSRCSATRLPGPSSVMTGCAVN